MTLTDDASGGGVVSGLYLLHFDPPYRHARHYLGFAVDVERRIAEHLAAGARSSPLVRAALAAGCQVRCIAQWTDGDRKLERRMKRQGGLSRHCPVCRASGEYHR